MRQAARSYRKSKKKTIIDGQRRIGAGVDDVRLRVKLRKIPLKINLGKWIDSDIMVHKILIGTHTPVSDVEIY